MDQDLENPFEYVRPLAPSSVTGRDEIVDRLLRAVRARRLVALTGPRRFGKTSVLGRVGALAADVDTVDVVSVDCFGVSSTGEFAVRVERALAELQGTARKVAARILDGSELGVSLAPGIGFKARLGTRDAPDPVAVLHELLGTLVTVAERGSGTLLVLDEFQDAGRVAGLDAILRSHLQTARDVAVVFAGSRPSLLRELFTDRARPFYSQAELIEVGRLDRAAASSIVAGGFDRTGRDAGDAAAVTVSRTEGHPQRLMLLAHLLWERVAAGGTATADDAAAALADAHARTAYEHEAVFTGLTRSQQDTVRAVATFGSPYAADAARALDLKAPSAQRAVKGLLDDAVIERTADTWRVVDPFFADWLRGIGERRR